MKLGLESHCGLVAEVEDEGLELGFAEEEDGRGKRGNKEGSGDVSEESIVS